MMMKNNQHLYYYTVPILTAGNVNALLCFDVSSAWLAGVCLITRLMPQQDNVGPVLEVSALQMGDDGWSTVQFNGTEFDRRSKGHRFESPLVSVFV